MGYRDGSLLEIIHMGGLVKHTFLSISQTYVETV